MATRCAWPGDPRATHERVLWDHDLRFQNGGTILPRRPASVKCVDIDTASHGGIILDQPLASLVGLVIATGSNAQIEVRVGDGAPVRVNIEPKGQI